MKFIVLTRIPFPHLFSVAFVIPWQHFCNVKSVEVTRVQMCTQLTEAWKILNIISLLAIKKIRKHQIELTVLIFVRLFMTKMSWNKIFFLFAYLCTVESYNFDLQACHVLDVMLTWIQIFHFYLLHRELSDFYIN